MHWTRIVPLSHTESQWSQSKINLRTVKVNYSSTVSQLSNNQLYTALVSSTGESCNTNFMGSHGSIFCY